MSAKVPEEREREREREGERERRRIIGGAGRTGAGRSRGVDTPLKHAETQNAGAGQEAGRPRFWER